MTTPTFPLQIEPRCPPAITVLAALGLLSVLPDRIRLFPGWVCPRRRDRVAGINDGIV